MVTKLRLINEKKEMQTDYEGYYVCYDLKTELIFLLHS